MHTTYVLRTTHRSIYTICEITKCTNYTVYTRSYVCTQYIHRHAYGAVCASAGPARVPPSAHTYSTAVKAEVIVDHLSL